MASSALDWSGEAGVMVLNSPRVRGSRPVPRAYQGRRLGTVYCYHTWRPGPDGAPTQVVEVGYVGQTVQTLAARDSQHRGVSRGPYGEAPRCQPWSDIIVGGVYVVEQGMWTCDELLRRELFHIDRLRPRYNHSGNLANRHRVPVHEARRQRQCRDRARGVLVTTWPAGGRTALGVRRRRPRIVRRVGLAAGYVGAVLVLWLLSALLLGPFLHVPWRTWPIASMVVAAIALVRMPRKRRHRRLAAAALGIAAVGLFVLPHV
jgi:hypothetical protein